MNPPIGSQPTHGQLAFWGHTNAEGTEAVVNIARQLRMCEAALDGRAAIGCFFYATRQPINDLMALAVRGAGGPSRWDGNWDDLTATLSADSLHFDTIICSSASRLGRPVKQLRRLDAVADHGATVLFADQSLVDFPPVDSPVGDRLVRRITAVVREDDYTSAEMLVRVRRECASGQRT